MNTRGVGGMVTWFVRQGRAKLEAGGGELKNMKKRGGPESNEND